VPGIFRACLPAKKNHPAEHASSGPAATGRFPRPIQKIRARPSRHVKNRLCNNHFDDGIASEPLTTYGNPAARRASRIA